MQVAKGIDVEDVDETGCKQKVLWERRKHMPRIKLGVLSDFAGMRKRKMHT